MATAILEQKQSSNTAATSSNGHQRIPQLDGVRALAITSVFIHHAFNIKLLWMGVDLFFVLSGFLITGILLKSRKKSFGRYIGAFYERRARRILPPYLVVMVITTAFLDTWWMRH